MPDSNGMKRKAERHKRAIRFDENGLPRDANEWTVQDWCSLWKAMKKAIKEIREHHANDEVS